MQILVLGGTRFVGRALVDQAVSRGHDVTTFTRGEHGEPRPGAQALHGDRTRPQDLAVLAARDWDAVIDTSVIAPAHVAAATAVLAGHAGHYTYISSLAVYPPAPDEPMTEDSATFDCPPGSGGEQALGYGPLKAGSERAVAAAFPGRHLIVRPGHLAGPHDNEGGLPWWLARLARGGRVLAPGAPDRPARLTDGRDLAAWTVDSIRRGITGVVNVPGPDGATLGQLLAACLAATAPVSDAPAELVWAPDEVLLAAGLEPGRGFPLWVPDRPGLGGAGAASGERARLAGMRYRPLADTVRDTWSWLSREAAAQAQSVTELAQQAAVGLDPAREREILARL